MTWTNYVCSRKYIFVFILAAASVLTSAVQGHKLEFAVEPLDTIVEAGHSAVLDCVVKVSDHSSNVLIQWLDQDRQVLTFIGDSYRSQLINGSLYINSVVEDQGLTGSYQCMASLPNIGSIVSRTAKLSLASLSGFLQEPHDITVYSGQKAYFACHVQASPPPKIKWLKDERPLQMDDLRMTILPSGALEIDEVQESDQGSYRCNASGLNTYRLSNKATFIINGDHEQAISVSPPSFIASPQSEGVNEGQNITLDCAANGNPTPKVTWLKDGFVIDMADLDSRFRIVGATTSLGITNIQEADAGVYQCRAANKEDSLDASATIQVQVPPKFLKKPEDKVDFVNKDTELECSVYGKPEPKVQWLKNGEIITPNDYYQFVNGNNLKIMGLMTSDSGIFQCVASNPAGNIQASAVLKVVAMEDKTKRNPSKSNRKKKLQLTRKLDDSKTLDRTQSRSLFSSLKSDKPTKTSHVGFSQLADTATTNQNPVFNAELNPHSFLDSLRSDSPSEPNESSLGNTAFSFASPKSNLGDDYMDPSKSLELLPGAPRDLKAPLVEARFVVLSWNPPLNSDDIVTYSVYYRQEGSERERVQNTSRARLEDISIGNLEPGRVYHFRVVAYNNFGAGSSSETLTVTTQSAANVPSAPQQMEAFATSSRSIHLNWKKPEVPNGAIKTYTVYYMEINSAVEHNMDVADLKCDIIGLSVYTEYSIWVVAVNEYGPGSATEEKLIRTYSDIPSDTPRNITVEPGSTSIVVRWEPPPAEGRNGPITGYKLRYRQPGVKKADTFTTPGNQTVFMISDLERATAYQIRLWAINVNGTGPPTEWIQVETYENDLDESRVPDAPSPLQVRAVPDKIYVMWTPPQNQNVKIRNYILGWGKGVADVYFHSLDEKQRSFVIENLQPQTEYVLSLRASNQLGAGPPVYANVRTQEDLPVETAKPLLPPVGLKVRVWSPTSVILDWTDNTLSKSQYIRDSRYYIVKYREEKGKKDRYINSTSLSILIDDLKPNTMYDFSVALIKGHRQSPFSMVVQNRTMELSLSAEPRNLDIHPKEDDPRVVELTWQPPKVQNGRITGYIILFTDDDSKPEREWSAEAINGDKHSYILTSLRPSTLYYFKIQARNSRGNGPFSKIISYRTGEDVGPFGASNKLPDKRGVFSGSTLLYLIVGGCLLAVTTIAVVIAVLCCRRKENVASPDRNKKGYHKGTQHIKPPDLWIHHDQMELKALEKSHSNNDGASSSGAMTLPRSVGNDYDAHDNPHSNSHTNSLDKRPYVPNYMGVSSPDEKNKRTVKPKPITLPVDAKPPKEPIATATPVNTSLGPASTDSTPSGRPAYPRTQYTISRAHVTIDQNAMVNNQTPESTYASHTSHCGYEPGAYACQPAAAPNMPLPPPGSTYAPGMNVLSETQAAKRAPVQGHPLKSFTVPAPPPISAPGTPQPKHIVAQPQVTIRPNSSPYKKASTSSSSTLTGTPPSRISASNPPPHTAEEVQRLQPSHSTEELNQEMANLEGLMLTLNAITANEFEC